MAQPGNPLREAMVARDIELLEASLADEVVLRSPIFSLPFEGKDEAVNLFAALYDVLGEMSYPFDYPGNPHVFGWVTDIDGEPLEGVDTVRYDASGKIAEVTVFMRPLRGIAAFLDKTGPRITKRAPLPRRIAMRVLGPPPSMMMRSVASLGPRLLGLKSTKK
jgi:hypothetical protein